MDQDYFDAKIKELLSGTVELIGADELAGKLVCGDMPVLLDTRSEAEYAVSRIPGAELIDYELFEADRVGHISKDREIIVYCSVGYRSEKIGEKLKALGFSRIRNLYGGIFDWKNNGYTVTEEDNRPTDRVHTYNEAWSEWLYKGVKVYD